LFTAIEEAIIRVRALFSGSSMAFLASNSRFVRTLFGYSRLNEGETFHQPSPSMRKFLELARMTLMEDIVAIEGIDKL
jgi:hypothetical protein